jgi:hypothetical protein
MSDVLSSSHIFLKEAWGTASIDAYNLLLIYVKAEVLQK